jgi:uncharacterized repeat protein (TIGR01451 family)
MPKTLASLNLDLQSEANQNALSRALQSASQSNAIHALWHGKLRFTALAAQAVVALAIIISASTVSWGAEINPCPSPNYTPDFSSDVSNPCIKFKDNASLVIGTSTSLQLTTSLGNQTGSAWYVNPQVISNGFSTTFQFQFTNPSTPPADGITFMIQNSTSGLYAIGYTGGNGGALGYGDDDANMNPSQGEGIPTSLAVEFDSFQNSWDPPAGTNGVYHVAIQSCGAGPNTSHHNYLCQGDSGPNSTIGAPVLTENFADGNMHTVTINYTPTCSTCTPATVANIQVYLDGANLYPGGVPVDLSSILTPTGTALVGFTGATGGDWETQDILNWTFSPTQEGQQINPSNPSTLTQTFPFNSNSGTISEFDFNYLVSQNSGTLTIPPGTTPFVNNAGIGESDWASIVGGTSMADASCFIAAGQNVCTIYTLECTNNSNSTPAGANCPQSTARNVLFEQELDLLQNQTNIVNGILTIPPGYAPGIAMAPDAVVPGGQCTYPAGGPLASQVCPQSIMTELQDNTPHGGGTGTTTNSSYIFFCCEPEWTSSPAIPLWNNSVMVPASFSVAPPPTPSPNPNNFHAAQGESVVVGAEPHGTLLDTTFPLPAEQTLNNAIPCPVPGVPPTATPWSTQNPQPFSVSGVISTYDNNGTASPLVEGAYDAHYFSVDCDAFEELVFPTTLNVQPGPPGANVALFKTVPFNVDLTKPTVTSITLNPPGGYYAQNSALTATVSCTDPTSSNVFSGIATCGAQGSPQAFSGQQSVTTTPITLSTSTIGTQTFNAAASDVAGNTSATSSVTYQVVGSAGLDIAMVGNLVVPTGTNMTYYIGVANVGPSVADGVTLTNPIPAGTTLVSAGFATESCAIVLGLPICTVTPPTTSCGNVAGTCNLGTLPIWSTKTPTGVVVQITVNVNAKVNATVSDTATVSEVNANPNSKYSTVKWQTLVIK